MEKDRQLQYCFSKYLETAVKRCRKDYLKKKYKIENTENLVEPGDIPMVEIHNSYWETRERDMEIPLDREKVLCFLEEHIEDVMLEALKKLRAAELEIFCMKALKQYSYKEIAERLNIDEKQAASIYNYAKKKLRKELGQ